MKRRGLTIVELLVVIAILATLLALLLPAVQRVRAALDQTRCLANLRTLGRALADFQAEKGYFPPGWRAWPPWAISSMAAARRKGPPSLSEIFPFFCLTAIRGGFN